MFSDIAEAKMKATRSSSIQGWKYLTSPAGHGLQPRGLCLPERTLYPPFIPAQSRVNRCGVFCCQLSVSGSSRGLFEEVPVRRRTTPVVDHRMLRYICIHPFRLGQCRMQHNSRYSIAAAVKVLARYIHCRKWRPCGFLARISR
jgi:hypothetical protein